MFADEDIRPTSTTMQFGDGDIEKLRMDMREEQNEEQNEKQDEEITIEDE